MNDVEQKFYKMLPYRLVILGATSVGKTSIIRYISGENLNSEETTVVASYRNVYLKNLVKFATWEVAGFERWHKLAPMYYKDAQAALVVYDVQDPESLVIAKDWIQELRTKLTQKLVIALAGNKVDLWDTWCIDSEEVQNYALQHDVIFMETSIRTGHNIINIFNAIGKQLKENPVNIVNTKTIPSDGVECVIL